MVAVQNVWESLSKIVGQRLVTNSSNWPRRGMHHEVRPEVEGPSPENVVTIVAAPAARLSEANDWNINNARSAYWVPVKKYILRR